MWLWNYYIQTIIEATNNKNKDLLQAQSYNTHLTNRIVFRASLFFVYVVTMEWIKWTGNEEMNSHLRKHKMHEINLQTVMKLVLRVPPLYYCLENVMASAGTKISKSCTDIMHIWQVSMPRNQVYNFMSYHSYSYN